MMPQDALARRLRALADEEAHTALDAAARARVEERALRQLGREARVRPVVLGLALAASVGLAYLAGMSGEDSASPTAMGIAGAVRGKGTPALGVSPTAPPPGACVVQSTWQASATRTKVLDLGNRALVVAAADARVSGGLVETCDTAFELAAGSMQVHARALEGHALRITTPLGQVQVKGTVFGVALSDDGRELAVLVLEGLVEVDTGTRAQVPANVHFSARRGDDGTLKQRTRALTRAEALALRTALGLARAAPRDRASLQTPDMAQADAESRAWHGGSVAAPRVPPEPGTSMTDDGRPMEKPAVVRERNEP